jgi:hypothetical protein
MFIRFRAHFDGDLWCAQAEGADIYVIGGSIVELMHNVDTAARVHYGERLAPGEDLHIMVASETLATA